MKIVHTSDWHVGRRWRGTDRLEEMRRVLQHLGDFIEKQQVELVLHTGDVFDTRIPEGDAEDLVNRFFLRMRDLKVDMVVIAGNHDDPARFEARAHLAQLANVRLIGHPRRASKGGTLTIHTRGGETAVIAALPFASVGSWVSALNLARDEGAAHSKYAEMFQRAMKDLCQPFREDAVNLVMAHTHLDGVKYGESERRVDMGRDWAVTAQAIPSSAGYVALGHIHLPQKVEGLLPAYYAGSPMQMDFGELDQQKTFAFITAAPAKRAEVKLVPYEGAWPLLHLEGTLEELARVADQYQTGSWLRVKVNLTEKDPDLPRKVRALFPNARVVLDNLPLREEAVIKRLPTQAPPEEHYAAFHTREHEEAPTPGVVEAFRQLYGLAADGEK